MLDIQNLSAAYGKAMALENITLNVMPGELVAVLGPNGAGKSTLLKAISRSLASQGTLTFEGRSLHEEATENVVGLGICHCPEGRRLFPELTVEKNLQLGAYLRNDKQAVAEDMQRVFELFPILSERGSQIVSTLSGGQQQMVAIGRALMGAPKLLLLDEPSVGIAHRLKMEIFAAIQQIRSRGVAILMAEQDAQSALHIADRVYVLEHGHVAQTGFAKDLAKDDRIRRIYLGLN
ncbi:MAG: ABC transporter ATP-binding protein [Burkholderiales bacterium]|jgi:branched-chain amino acid transport system ATP-binding protein|nr:ABC transporter ATP-binding protein [Burkholderiales bacterium]